MNKSLKNRFLNKVNYSPTGCWIWAGSRVDNHKGLIYGQIWVDGKLELAHRVSWILYCGEIPKGLTVHHKCNNTLCVNPFHLEVMPLRENILLGNNVVAKNARKTHCPKGHLLTGLRIYRGKQGRYCKECKRLSNHRLIEK